VRRSPAITAAQRASSPPPDAPIPGQIDF